MDVTRSLRPAPFSRSHDAASSTLSSALPKKEAVPSYRPRSTVSVTRAEAMNTSMNSSMNMSMNSSMNMPMNMSLNGPQNALQSTALPVISEAVPCEGMREISGGVYEDGTGRTVAICTRPHA